MTPEQWHEIKDKLNAAIDMNPKRRSAYLAELSVAHPELREEIESLLACHDGMSTDFLEKDILGQESPPSLGGADETLLGRHVGPYRIVEQLGSGGMGEVFRAVRSDDQYQKEVAVKLVRAGYDSGLVLNRFKNERQILATLEHPNISRLLDGGATEEGVPYLVMELIDGKRIDTFCDEHKLGTTERLKLLLEICSAVQYAHQRLIIHRDIKPSNILVTRDGVPKLLDFGIAKILDPTAAGFSLEDTLTAFRVFTPGYASPEQVKGEPITTATDVYSLGVILYELLTGRSPYAERKRTSDEINRAVCEIDPDKPSSVVIRSSAKASDVAGTPAEMAALRDVSPQKLRNRLRGDLDSIVLKAIRKEPQGRYSSAEFFAEDISRHLNNLPVMARKDSLRYRTSKFVRRHKASVAAAGTAIAAILVALGLVAHEAGVALEQQRRAEQRFNDVRKLANSLIFEIHDSVQTLPGATVSRKLILERAREYLDDLAKEATGDTRLQRELAAAYERVGDVLGKPRTPSLGDDEGALQSYKKSFVLREILARKNPREVQDVVGLARISREISELLAAVGRLGDSLKYADQAVALSSSMTDSSSPDRKDVLVELLLDHVTRGGVEYNSIPRGGLERPEAALQDYGRALQITADLLTLEPGNPIGLHQKAVIYERIGRIFLRTGHPKEAFENLSTSHDLFRALAADPNDARAQRNLAASDSMFGDALAASGRFGEALGYYREELSIFQKLSEVDSRDMDAQIAAGSSYTDVGACLMRQGTKLNEALNLVDQGNSIISALAASNSKNPILHSMLAENRIASGEILGRLHLPAQALQNYRTARAIYTDLALANPQNLDARLMGNATDAKIALTLLQLGDLDQSHRVFSEVVAISEPAANAHPASQPAQYTLADAYQGLGDIASRLAMQSKQDSERTARWQEAISWYEKSLHTWHAIPNRRSIDPNGFDIGDPSNVEHALQRSTAGLRKVSRTVIPKR